MFLISRFYFIFKRILDLCYRQLSYLCVNLIRWSRSRQWHLTPVLLPGKFHGQSSLVGYSPWGRKSRTRLSDQSHDTVFLQVVSLSLKEYILNGVGFFIPHLILINVLLSERLLDHMVYKTKQTNLHISLLILTEKIFYLNMMNWLIFKEQ